MDILTRGMLRELKVVFTTPTTGVVFDPTSPTVEIVHYDGTTEQVDLAETPMTKIHDGHYLYNWTVPNTFPENVVAFVYYRGTDGSSNRLLFEEKLRVVPVGFYASPASGMVVKFTKD